MYFLNGDRIYIKPESGCSTLEEQWQSCLYQLKRINSGKRIFKLNYFVDTGSGDAYRKLQNKVREFVAAQFPEKIIQSFIAQPPITCKIVVEAFFYDYLLWSPQFIVSGEGSAVLFRRENTEILVGNVQAGSGKDCRTNAKYVFGELGRILDSADFPVKAIVRQWNYIENILGFDGSGQRYQEFNNIRSEFYGNAFEQTGFPAATGIGMNRGGLIIEFVAVKSADAISRPIDNPRQVSAHRYSETVLVGDECVLKTTPKFERARYLELFGKKLIFISGTASITGEKTVGVGDPAEQTEVTIENIRNLYSDEVLAGISNNNLLPKYGHARVYIKNKKDFHSVKRQFKLHYGNLPVVYIVADICRNDLLVEIEGKVILE